MGKHEPMTAKAIANKIKAKGLQKLKYYCEMCKKQCRDDNGFKCHIQSEAHQRQALIVSQNPDQFVNEYSSQFMEAFMHIVRARYRSKSVLANTVFQDYIKDKQHIHMNATRWTSLTEFAEWLSEKGYVKIDHSERGILITYIDRDPETLRRQELEAKRAQQAKEAAIREQKEIELQREMTAKIYENIEKSRQVSVVEPVPIVKVVERKNQAHDLGASVESSAGETEEKQTEPECDIVERPLFKVQPVALKTPASSRFKPPPPKRKVVRNNPT